MEFRLCRVKFVTFTFLLVVLCSSVYGLTQVNDCGVLNIEHEIYNLTQNVQNTSNCFTINATNITLDMNGYNVTGEGSGNGVYITSENATVENGTIRNFSIGINALLSNDSSFTNIGVNNNADGVSFASCSNNTLINITANNNTDDGIFLSSSHNNTIINITASNNTDDGIELSASHDNTITDVITNDNNDNGIYFIGSLRNTLINITANNNIDDGIELVVSHDNTIMNVTTNDNNDGIYLNGNQRNTLIDITANNNTRYGINVASSLNNNLINSTTNNNQYGVRIYLSQNNNLTNTTVNSNTHSGIYIYQSGNNTVTDTTSNNNAVVGIYNDRSSDNTYTGGNISNEAYGLRIFATDTHSKNNMFRDMVVTNTTGSDVYLETNFADSLVQNNTFLNVTYSTMGTASGTGGGPRELTRKWYYRLYVNDSLGRTLVGASVIAKNKTGITIATATTNSSGEAELYLIEYISTNGTNQSYSNYTINISYEEYNFTRTFNATGNSLSNNFEIEISATTITDCQTLSQANAEYILLNNVSNTSTCFTINASNVTLDLNGCNVTGDGTGIGVYITAENVTVENGIIRNFTEGISLLNSNYSIIRNNLIYNVSDMGISLDSSHDVLINNNTVYNVSSYYGMVSVSGNNTFFVNNIISNCISSGIFTNFHNNVLIANNTIYNVTNGANAVNGNNFTIINNTIYENSYSGIYVRTDNNIITNNTVYNNTYYGIYVRDGEDADIRYNEISDTPFGIMLLYFNNSVIIGNTISETLIGVWAYASVNHTILQNTLDNNTIYEFSTEVSSSVSYVNNSITGNCSGTQIRNSTEITYANSNMSNCSISISKANATLINITYNNSLETVENDSTLIRVWYYRLYVNDTNGNAVASAVVSTYNSTNSIINTTTTNSTGWTGILDLTEYLNINGNKSYFNNYTIHVANGTHYTNHSYNATSSNTQDVLTVTNRTLVEVCGNSLDDDFDGRINEGCTVSNPVSNGGGGGGGGAPPATYFVIRPSVKVNIRAYLSRRIELNLTELKEVHKFNVTKIDYQSKTATFTLESEKQTYTLSQNKSVKVDLDNNGVYDIIVQVTDIYTTSAVFSIEHKRKL